jgi:hypothetical protein
LFARASAKAAAAAFLAPSIVIGSPYELMVSASVFV